MQRHETDAISLAFGVIFVALGGLFVTGSLDAYDFVSIWALPAVLLAVGLVLGAVAVSRHRKAARARGGEPLAEESDPVVE